MRVRYRVLGLGSGGLGEGAGGKAIARAVANADAADEAQPAELGEVADGGVAGDAGSRLVAAAVAVLPEDGAAGGGLAEALGSHGR